ncbi:MAG: helix-turn-helix domain-containing protein [bacterium]
MTDTDPKESKKYTERLLKITIKLPDRYYYIRTLLFYAIFPPKVELRNKTLIAYNLAADMGNEELMARALFNLSEYYIFQMQYDSATICLLGAKEHFKKNNSLENEVQVMHQLGNIFYAAGIYDRAEKYFKEVIKLKGHPEQWFNWRKFVMTIDLGLIEKQRKQYDSAIFYFKKSLSDLLSDHNHVLNVTDTIRMVYSNVNLASLYILKNDLKSSEEYLNIGFSLEPKHNLPENMIQLFLTKGQLLFYQSKYDSSLYYLKKAKEMNDLYGSIEFAVQISEYVALAYGKKNDFKNAWEAGIIHKRIADSLQVKKNIYKSLQLIYVNELNEEKSEAATSELQKNLLLGIMFILTISILIVSVFYVRIKKIKNNLMNKNIELIKSEMKFSELEQSSGKLSTEMQYKENDKHDESDRSDKFNSPVPELGDRACDESELLKIKRFSVLLEREMNLRQLYSDPSLTLDSLAHMLHVNRNFLSKAINHTYNLHFNNYINNLRIKHAVELLSNPDESNRYTIEGIAQKVGFCNRSTFSLAFKQFTGLTASIFIKQLRDNGPGIINFPVLSDNLRVPER